MALRTGNLLMNIFKRSKQWKDLQGEDLLHLKKEMQDIMDDVVHVCERYELRYFLAYGSALGAIRHNGYNPWDDDIDLCMPRLDNNRFLEIASKELTEKYYILSVSKGDDVAVPTCHIHKKGTHYVNFSDMVTLRNQPEDVKGVYIDIFPLENAYNNKWIRMLDGYVNLGLQFIISNIVPKR